MAENNLSLDQVIKFHRASARLTQHELAKLAGVGKTVVFDIENGKRTIRFNTLLAILETLNITLEWNSPLKNVFQRSAVGTNTERKNTTRKKVMGRE